MCRTCSSAGFSVSVHVSAWILPTSKIW
jgi:hypothetical protein